MIRIEDVKKLEKRIVNAIASYGEDSDEVMNALSNATGPETGLIWDGKNLNLANGYVVSDDGLIVNPIEFCGPATGYEYRDGHVRKVAEPDTATE